MKDREFTCLDDILVKIKKFSKAKERMIREIITVCTLFLVNPATSATGDKSFLLPED